MKSFWYFANMCLIPVFFLIVLAANMKKAFKNSFYEVASATAENKRYFSRKTNSKG